MRNYYDIPVTIDISEAPMSFTTDFITTSHEVLRINNRMYSKLTDSIPLTKNSKFVRVTLPPHSTSRVIVTANNAPYKEQTLIIANIGEGMKSYTVDDIRKKGIHTYYLDIKH